MPVETGNYINDLNASYPGPSDSISYGDDHIRLLKKTIKSTFPNVDGPVELTTQDFADLKDGIGKGGVAASLKYNGSSVMYGHNIASVQIPAPGGSGYGSCRVTFKDSLVDDWDHHYAVLVQAYGTANASAFATITDQRADYVEWSWVVWDGQNMVSPPVPLGFSMIVVDIFQG